MHKIIIAGGPHSGKTTTFNALRGIYHPPEAHFVAEPADRVIARELAQVDIEPKYDPIVPLRHYPRFVPLVLAESVTLESQIPPETRLAFHDRSIIDNFGYGTLNDYTDEFERIERFVGGAHYSLVFFCARLGSYAATEIRHETEEQAQLTHEHIRAAYDLSGLPIIELPPVSVNERITMIQAAVSEL
jgi:predicted ATPase